MTDPVPTGLTIEDIRQAYQEIMDDGQAVVYCPYLATFVPWTECRRFGEHHD